MAQTSSIEWTEATWNPTVGCTKISPGCKHCYAEAMSKRLQAMGTPGYENGFKLVVLPDRLDEPLRRKKPTVYFVNSMSDLFHKNVLDDYVDRVFDVISRCPQHTFQILTKRAERLSTYFRHRFPPKNAWIGVSVENRECALQRIDALRQSIPSLHRMTVLDREGYLVTTSSGRNFQRSVSAYLWDHRQWLATTDIESLDVMIGIITVYLIFALACTAIVEAISAWFDVRSKNLEAALEEFLHGNITEEKSFVEAFFDHPIVQSLSKGADGRPSYINPENVGRVVADLIYAKEGVSSLKQAVGKLPGTLQSNRIKGLLDSLQNDAKEDIAAFRKLIENHYDAVMDRASGWYKRYAQKTALFISAALVVIANVDTISITSSLSSNPNVKAKMVEIAQRQLDAAKEAAIKPDGPAANTGSTTGTDPVKEANDRSEKAAETLAKANADLSSAGIKLGWKAFPAGCSDWVSKIIGLLISILAISLGAPFWFDMLSRVMQVRAAGVSPRDKKPSVPGEAKTGS